jgi:hypothetical protein
MCEEITSTAAITQPFVSSFVSPDRVRPALMTIHDYWRCDQVSVHHTSTARWPHQSLNSINQ